MPKLSTVQTNFTAGEWTPRLLGRTELPNYQNAAEFLENVIVQLHGGARRRDGLRFVASAKNAAKKARLIPFIYSSTDAYILEVGDLYIRFYKNGARLGAPYEIATSITEAMLPNLDYSQIANAMVAAHQSLTPQRLRRFADTAWSIDAVPFTIAPFDEIGHSFSASLTLSAATVGVGRTAAASSGIFLNGDVGRQIIYLGGVFKITAFTDTQHVTGDITSDFQSVAVPTDVWTLDGSPLETITPSLVGPIETVITLTSAALNIWRAADVGKFVRINGGIVQISVFTTALVVSAVVKQILTAAVAAPKDAWSLEASVWSAGNGYPRAVTQFQQRLCFGGSPAYPQTIWGSSVGAPLDYLLGAGDSDAFAYTLSSDQTDPIQHMGSGKVLFSLTYSTEFTIKGGIEKPITPTNVQVESQSAYGCGNVRQVRVNKDFLYIDQTTTQLLAYVYNASDEDFDADDLTLFAEHISGAGFVDLSYCRKPDPLVYAPRVDGQMPTLAYSSKQQVAAWTRAITDGIIESVATIPVTGGHQTWVLVRRTVNGATVRYVERFDSTLMMDSGLNGTSGPGQATWPAAHLEGKSIDCVADGRYIGRFTVAGGTFTLPRTAFAVTYGLPYTHRIKLLTPEVSTSEGTAQGNAMSTHQVVINFLNTFACKVNGNDVDFRNFGPTLLDQPLTPFTGLKPIENLGWDLGASDIDITSAVPLPFHVRAVIRKWTVNTG